MSGGITVSCASSGLDDFTDQLDSAGIDCETFERKPGIAYAASGDILDIAENAAPYPARVGSLVLSG